jgi:hypothetical protein
MAMKRMAAAQGRVHGQEVGSAGAAVALIALAVGAIGPAWVLQ